MNNDLLALICAAGLTVAVFSYLLGDNPLYRLALHLLVGVSSGYAAFIALRTLIFNQIIQSLTFAPDFADLALVILPLVGVFLLFLKINPKWGKASSVVLGFLVGVGAAIALQSILLGTVLPLARASVVSLDWAQPLAVGSTESAAGQAANAGLLLLGTALALLFFTYGGFRPPKGNPQGHFYRPLWFTTLSTAGQAFVVLALAALYAGALSSALSLLTDRLFFLFDTFSVLLKVGAR